MAKHSKSRKDGRHTRKAGYVAPVHSDVPQDELWAQVDELLARPRGGSFRTPETPSAASVTEAPLTLPDDPSAPPAFPLSEPLAAPAAREETPPKKAKKRWKLPVLLAAIGTVLLCAAILFVCNGGATLLAVWLSGFGPTSSVPPSSVTPPSSSIDWPELPKQTLPSPLRGGYFELPEEAATVEEWRTAVGQALDRLAEWNFNTLLLPLTDGKTALYSSEVWERHASLPQEFDLPAYVLDAAAVRGVTVIAVVDLGVRDGYLDPTHAGGGRQMETLAAEAAAYPFDGFLVTGYGYEDRSDTGPAISDALEASMTAAVKQAVAALRTGEDRPIGLLADALWADAATEGGVDTEADAYSSLLHGKADTRAWVQAGTFDFVMMRGERTAADEELSFTQLIAWWDTLCREAELPLYSLHTTEKIGTEGDWELPEEVSLQCMESQKKQSWQGAVVSSPSALAANEEALRLLLQTLSVTSEDGVDSATVLTFASPTETRFSTAQSLVTFRGSADARFPLWMNGEEVPLTERGLFGIDCELEVGPNTFTFVHKGKTVTYSIYYEIEVLLSVAPEEDLSLPGGTTIAFSAVVYKDATVSATIAGENIPMVLSPRQNEEDAEINDNADYETFTGQYTLPPSEVSEQSLGYITVFATYGQQTEALQGGLLTVKAKPPPPPTTTTTTTVPTTTTTTTVPSVPDEPDDPADTPDDPVESTTTTTRIPVVTPPAGSGSELAAGTLILITEDYAETFNGTPVEDYSRPNNAYLPAGTLDVLVSESYDAASGNLYYLLGCGRRVYQSAAQVYGEGALTANRLTVGDTVTDDRYTTLTLQSLWSVPYQLQLLPQEYPYSDKSYPVYDIKEMTAEWIDITFAYTPEAVGTPDVSDSPLFADAAWVAGEANTCTLRLTLREKGQFYGYFVQWAEDGTLTFKFRHPTYLGENSEELPLQGMTIVLDAGHGAHDPGAIDPIYGVYEKTLNLDYALTLRTHLEALGATVVMTREDDSPLTAHDITVISRREQPDLFISVHMNSAGASSANGPSTHYFNEYSYVPASLIFAEMYAAYAAEKETTERGARWDPFYVTRVHDCPSVLLECGFISNAEDFELLYTEEFREKLCAAVARGVVAYGQTLPQLSVPSGETPDDGAE